MKARKFPLLITIIFLSAGCSFFNKPVSAGVIKTVNGGTDWQFANIIKNSTNGSLAGLNISKIAFDPTNHQALFVGGFNGGLYKSEDSAGAWTNILSKINVYDFAINPYDPKTIYAAGIYADHGRVLKTTDGGASWNQVYNEESSSNAVRTIALNPLNPSQMVIGTDSGSLVKSSDAGNTWQLVKNFNSQLNRALWQNNNIYVLAKTRGVFVSTSTTDSFAEITTPITKAQTGSFSYGASPIDSFSQMFADFTSPGLIYVTTSQGLYKTVDLGQHWSKQTLPVKPDETSAHAIAIAQNSSNVVYTSVGSTMYKSLDGGNTWQTQGINSSGFIEYVLIDPQLSQIVYGGIYNTQ